MTVHPSSPRRLVASSLLVLACTGCVQRTIVITSAPEGALVWLNDREVGRTPLEVEFEYYGVYDVRIERDGFEPLSTSASADSPWWETIPLDLLAEIAPLNLESRVAWHYDLRPADDDPEALLERARDLRSEAEGS